MIKIKKGLDLPIAGAPDESTVDTKTVRSVAILGEDYPGMKPTMAVAEGETVKRGQVLFSDKKTEGVVFTAPASGTVASINRGAKRAFISVVIDVSGDEAQTFKAYDAATIQNLERSDVIEQLLQSGAWTSLRTRPFSRIPAPTTTPHSIFVTAMDTNPLSADPKQIIAGREEAFAVGLTVMTRLTDGPVHLCQDEGSALQASSHPGVTSHTFAGPHPAGLPGTHIHFVDPVSPSKTVWFVGYQDVIAIGHLFLTGTVLSERVIALAGPGVTNSSADSNHCWREFGRVVSGRTRRRRAAGYFWVGTVRPNFSRSAGLFGSLSQSGVGPTRRAGAEDVRLLGSRCLYSLGLPGIFVQMDWRKICVFHDNDQWQYSRHGAYWNVR